MKVIFVRSPYKILVDEATQVYTKCVIVISDPAGVLPNKTVTLEKQIPDTVNRDCWFNISPYIKDEIENIEPSSPTASNEDANMWRIIEVTTYWKINLNDEWTEYEVQGFVAVNGYTNYKDGYNQSNSSDVVFLTNTDINIYANDANDVYKYFNILVDYDYTLGFNLVYRYRNLAGTIIEDVAVINTFEEIVGIFMLKVPYRTATAGLENGNSVQVRLDPSEPKQPRIKFLNGDNCLYTPVVCSFINSYGGWQYLTFFKARTDSYEVKSKGFNLLADAVDYNPLRGQRKEFNFNLMQSVKLNTGWVDENTIELLVELMASETILLDNEPATLKDKSLQKKTRLKDKMINYEMNFEYSFNLINDVD
jgi:hypothetical protein